MQKNAKIYILQNSALPKGVFLYNTKEKVLIDYKSIAVMITNLNNCIIFVETRI